jgi:tRNA dimethylallyltransferase
MHKKQIIVIAGPTASGKTDLALTLAAHINGEIINADIGSFYTPLSIGTAKPDWKNQKTAHHLFDVLDQPKNFTVVEFRTQVQKLIQEIWSRGHMPIIVGGSAFYIKSLFFRQHDIAGTSEIVAQLESDLDSKKITSLQLWDQLHTVDPARAAKIHPHDAYRLVRAVAIFQATHQTPSNFEQIFDPIACFHLIVCKPERSVLYERINQRVGLMLQQGWIEEVRYLSGAWAEFVKTKKIIGYDDLLYFLHNPHQKKLNQIQEEIAQKTRHYAKRQIIFLNKLEKQIAQHVCEHKVEGIIEEVNLTLCDVGLYIKGLSNRILQNLK